MPQVLCFAILALLYPYMLATCEGFVFDDRRPTKSWQDRIIGGGIDAGIPLRMILSLACRCAALGSLRLSNCRISDERLAGLVGTVFGSVATGFVSVRTDTTRTSADPLRIIGVPANVGHDGPLGPLPQPSPLDRRRDKQCDRESFEGNTIGCQGAGCATGRSADSAAERQWRQ